jgi:cardiolipin synthase (CMP-forming)
MLAFSQLPNLITISRIALVPLLILLLKDQDYLAALILFFIAGVSDGLDGWIAKRFNFKSRLGSILDPLADKILLVSAYVMLAVLGHVPFWLVLTVGFRDLLIVGGYLVYTSLIGSVHMRPSYLSKFNTLMQITLIVVILVQQAAGWTYPMVTALLIYTVLATTLASGLHYLWIWGVMKEVEMADGSRERGTHETGAQRTRATHAGTGAPTSASEKGAAASRETTTILENKTSRE